MMLDWFVANDATVSTSGSLAESRFTAKKIKSARCSLKNPISNVENKSSKPPIVIPNSGYDKYFDRKYDIQHYS